MKKILLIALLVISANASMCIYYLDNSNKYLELSTHNYQISNNYMGDSYKNMAISALIKAKFECSPRSKAQIQINIDNLKAK